MASLAQFEAEAIAWINMTVLLLCFPLFGVYAYQTLEDVENIKSFLEYNPRGYELFSVFLKFFVLAMIWVPMSVILKIAASQRNTGLLKIWIFSQVVLIFIVALHLLIQPPQNLTIVLAYAVVFSYFLISLWICERLIKEIKEETKPTFRHLDVESDSQTATLNDENSNEVLNTNEYGYLEIQMKKVVKN